MINELLFFLDAAVVVLGLKSLFMLGFLTKPGWQRGTKPNQLFLKSPFKCGCTRSVMEKEAYTISKRQSIIDELHHKSPAKLFLRRKHHRRR